MTRSDDESGATDPGETGLDAEPALIYARRLTAAVGVLQRRMSEVFGLLHAIGAPQIVAILLDGLLDPTTTEDPRC